ncbi:CRISPR-associated endonuclease Cas2 [Candidatus Giovannonibacteria bacterium]|nr:CRISPR-associated endonuclease Cas2 [Candidatus Giovannonibacteria bacterium]
MARHGRFTMQILELLTTGFVLGFTRDKRMRRELLEECDRIWYEIDRKQLYRFLDRLHLQKCLEFVKTKEGVENIRLTNKGRARFLEHQFRKLVLKPARKWDKKWRLVFFDIPETQKKIRDALRRKLKELGFLEFQKSVFVYPYSCRDEINFILNFWNISEYVHYIEASITSDYSLRRHFKLE